MKNGNKKINEIDSLIKLAKNDFKHANMDLDEGFYRQAVVSAYYVVLSSSRALLLKKGYSPKSHSGVFVLLNDNFVQKDLLPKNYSKIIGNLFRDRLDANYNAQVDFTKKDAKEAIEFAEEYLEKVLKLIK